LAAHLPVFPPAGHNGRPCAGPAASRRSASPGQ